MNESKRTIRETIDYFKYLSLEYEREWNKDKDLLALGKSEAYELAAFNLEKNLKMYILGESQ